MTADAPTRTTRRLRLTRAQWGALLLYMLCQFLIILDTAGVNIALAAIARDFDVPVDRAGAVNLGFAVTVAIMIPLSGWLGERFGTVRVLVASLGVVVVGSVICAMGVSLTMVVVGRVVQGIGAGGLPPLAIALLFRTFPPSQRLRVMAAVSMIISLAPALGPLVGGLLVDTLGWPWAFLLNVPIGTAAVIIALSAASEVHNRAVRRLDVWGAILCVIGFGSTVYGIERLATDGAVIVGGVALAVGVVALGVLVPWERKQGDRAFLNIPLLLSRRVFAKTTTITALHAMAFLGFGMAGPLLLQTQLGLSAFEAGLLGAVNAAGPFIASRFARQLIGRIGPRAAIALSQSGMIVGLGVITLGYALASYWTIGIGLFLWGVSAFFTTMSCQLAGFGAVPHSRIGDATSIDGTSRQLGGAFGIAAVSGALAAAALIDAPMLLTVVITIGALAVFHGAALVVLAAPGRLPLPTDDDQPATPDR